MYYSKEQVLSVLNKVYSDSSCVLLGEQCSIDPAEMLDVYAKATGGKQPAVLGYELCRLPDRGVGSEYWHNTLSVLKDYAAKGGIITTVAHLANPSGRYTTDKFRGSFSHDDWEEMLTDGTEYNRIIKEELRIEGLFMKELDSVGIPVLWRPLHEVNGNWFWFCGKTSDGTYVDPSYMKRFWKMIYDMYTVEMGMKNLIWVYSPNISNGDRLKDVLYYYPGDDMCDIVGVDWYTANKCELNEPGHSYDKIMSLGKPAVIAEFGPAGNLRDEDSSKQVSIFNAIDMLNLFKNFKANGLKIAYVLTWCKYCGSIAHLGKADEAVRDPFAITLDKLAELYE